MKIPIAPPLELAPEGTAIAALVEVKDQGEVTDQFGTRHIWRLGWTFESKDSKGRNHRAFQRVTPSLHPKSTLYTVVVALTSDVPDKDFDSSTLIGKCARLVIVYAMKGDKTYANIQSVLPLRPTDKPFVTEVRAA